MAPRDRHTTWLTYLYLQILFQANEHEQLIDNSPVGIFYTDKDGDCSFVNRRWCEITGLAPHKANHKNWLIALHPEDRLRCQQDWLKAFKLQTTYCSEHRYLHKDGSVVWALVQAYPTKQSEEQRYIGTIVDISAQKTREFDLRNTKNKLKYQHAQNIKKLTETQSKLNLEKAKFRAAASALSETEARWKSFVENSFDFILTVNPQRIITFVNRDLYNESAANIIGKSIAEIFTAEQREVITNAVNLVFLKGEPVSYETKFEGKDKLTMWYACRVGPIIRNNKIIEVTLIYTDITERINIEEQIQQHQNKLTRSVTQTSMLEVISGLAHELNQPLTAINNYLKGMFRRLKQHDLTLKKIEEISLLVENQAERANAIINHMRSFVKDAALNKQKHCINQTIEEAISYLDPQILDSAQISLSIDSYIPHIMIDKIQIEQVIINIIQNAFEECQKSPNHGKIRIYVETSQIDNYVIINIIDNGPGIEADLINKIFNPFVTTKSNGLGMGLAICRSIIEAHNGHLSASNNTSKGAIFTIKLPIK